MKTKAIILISFILLVAGCVTTKQPMEVSTPHEEPCPIPSGYKLAPALEVAEQTLTRCPNKLDQVFSRLLEISNHSPGKENSMLIQDMLKSLVKKNKVSETYAKSLYRKYFSARFVTLPDVKAYNLSGEIDSIKKQLRHELTLKKAGLIECCDDKAGYKRAEAEFARVISFIENLVLNEEYLKQYSL